MPKKNRSTLKNYFKKGCLPSEAQFGDLVDSTLNIIDEGFDKTPESGLKITQIGEDSRLLSFYRHIDIKSPIWSITIDTAKKHLLFNSEDDKSILALDPAGRVGINKQDPEHTLDVEGTLASKGRIGRYKEGAVPADGRWHPIIEKLDGCRAYEIMAGVGKKKSGKYALLHAFALSAFNANNHIDYHQAHYQSRCNRIKLRWVGGPHDYALEMRTCSSYGDGIAIRYAITELWFDYFMEGSAAP
jgi:hypothetical protein